MKMIFLLLLVLFSCDNHLEIIDPEINPPIVGEVGEFTIHLPTKAGTKNFYEKLCADIVDYYCVILWNDKKIFTFEFEHNYNSMYAPKRTFTAPIASWQIIVVAGTISEQDDNCVVLVGASDRETININANDNATVSVQMNKLNNRFFCMADIPAKSDYQFFYRIDPINDYIVMPDTMSVRLENDEFGVRNYTIEKIITSAAINYQKQLTAPYYSEYEYITITDFSSLYFTYNTDIVIPMDGEVFQKKWKMVSEKYYTESIGDEIYHTMNYVVTMGDGYITIIW